jgi:outer membrane protein assembly factor BamB
MAMNTRSRTLQLAVLVSIVTSLLVLAAPAASIAATGGAAITLKPAVGPPTTLTSVKGSGYQPGEIIAILFDAVRIGSARTGRTGKFTKHITVPATALPGNHIVEADGLTSGLVAQATFLVRTDWLQGCFEAGRSCYNPYENVIDPGSANLLATSWGTAIGASGLGSAVYSGGNLYAGGADGLYELDPSTGAIIINYRAGPVLTTPAVIPGSGRIHPKVVFGSTDGNIYAIDTTDARVLWQVSLGAAPTSLLAACFPPDPCKVIVGAGDTLFAFDPNGNRLWETMLEGGDISKAAALFVEPDTSEARVIVPAGNTLYKIDVATGAELWSVAPSRSILGAPSIGNPNIVGDPNLLVGDAGGNLYSIDPASGAVKATFTAGGAITGSPAIGDPNSLPDPWVFVGDSGGNIYAFDTTDDFPPPIWQAALGGPVDGPPVLANGVLYVGTDPAIGDPTLFGLDAATGKVLLQAALRGRMASEPMVSDGMVVIGIDSGDIFQYQGPDT